MRKRIFALLLAFCFALTVCPALGEDALLLLPTRDLGAVEVTVDERLQTLLDIMSYAIPEDCYGDSAVAVLTDAQMAEQANLKLTSLYELAQKAGLPDPQQFVQQFIDYEEARRRES